MPVAMSTPWRPLFLMLAGAALCAAGLMEHDSQGNITCSQVGCTNTSGVLTFTTFTLEEKKRVLHLNVS